MHGTHSGGPRRRFGAGGAMDDELSVVDLVVRVRPAYRVSRWAWHLVDRHDGREFESEFEYDSASEAHLAGLRRLAELTRSATRSRAA
jgi:hypothetical protein